MNIKSRRRSGYVLLLPVIVVSLIFILYPVVSTIVNSLFEYRTQTMAEGKKWVGLAQYAKLLKDKQMWASLRFTVLFTLLAVILETVLGMLCALMMNQRFSGQALVRAVILIPWAIPTIVSGLLWKFMLSESYGVINQVLIGWGVISDPIRWITEPSWAFWAVIVADVWKTAPYMSLQLLAGLQNISKDMYEAASIDGANAFRRFLNITLPMLRPVLLVALLFRTISSFRIYDLVSVLTNGGPANQTMSLTMFTIRNYYSYGNIGYGSAAAVLTFIITLIIALFFAEAVKSKLEVSH